MKVFVTGGTGLLGNNIIAELLKREHQVTALVRSVNKGQQILDSTVHLVEGDLRQTGQFSQGLRGIDVLIHSAAYYGEYYRQGNGQDLLRNINVSGTVELLKMAYQQGIRNVVYISSGGVLQSPIGRATDESAPYADNTPEKYFQSKIEAEREIYRFMKSYPAMRIVLILPSVMLGPGDYGPTPIGKLITNVVTGKMKIVLDGSLSIVDARDVALAAVEAIEKGQSGERYLVGGRNYAYQDVMQTLANVSGIPAPSRKPAPIVLNAVARVMETMSGFTGKPPSISRAHLKRIRDNFWYSSAKAERELTVTFRPLSETLTDTVQWFRAHGYA